jgi:hypothetical protein
MQVLTKLEQTSIEQNQETSNLKQLIIRLVLWTCKQYQYVERRPPFLCDVCSSDRLKSLQPSSVIHVLLPCTSSIQLPGTLNMKAAHSFETLEQTCYPAGYKNPEDQNLSNTCSENQKTYNCGVTVMVQYNSCCIQNSNSSLSDFLKPAHQTKLLYVA